MRLFISHFIGSRHRSI